MPEIFATPESISIVVPVYNSCHSLRPLVERLTAVLLELQRPYEIILVDDGSRDESWPAILELHQAFSSVRGVHLMRNYGQHNALLCGVRLARHDLIVTLDDDLQNPPEEIPKLLAGLPGYDVVYGDPHHQQHGLWRNFASWFIRLALQTAMGVENARKVSAFRLFRTHVRDAFADYRSPFVTLDVLLSWGTTRFNVVDVRHAPRQAGHSNYTLSKLLRHAADMITGFTILPLQLASWMGMILAGFGVLVLIYVVGRFIINGGSVPGFPFLASIIAIFSGAQLFALGIIGEYLARMHLRIMDKPSYVVREELTR